MKSRFFIREMHGSFVGFRLIRSLTVPLDKETNLPESVVAHMCQIPPTGLSVYLGNTDFNAYWITGPEKTSA